MRQMTLEIESVPVHPFNAAHVTMSATYKKLGGEPTAKPVNKLDIRGWTPDVFDYTECRAPVKQLHVFTDVIRRDDTRVARRFNEGILIKGTTYVHVIWTHLETVCT